MHWKLVIKTACIIPMFLKAHEFALDLLWQWEYASQPICQYELFFLQKFDDSWHHCIPISKVTIKSVEVWVGWMWYQLRLRRNKNRDIWSHLFHKFNPLLGGHLNMFLTFFGLYTKLQQNADLFPPGAKKREVLGMNFDLRWESWGK